MLTVRTVFCWSGGRRDVRPTNHAGRYRHHLTVSTPGDQNPTGSCLPRLHRGDRWLHGRIPGSGATDYAAIDRTIQCEVGVRRSPRPNAGLPEEPKGGSSSLAQLHLVGCHFHRPTSLCAVKCIARSSCRQETGSPRPWLNVTPAFQRFNVAITRAKALLIVVGNPVVLRKDYRWRLLLRLCTDYQAYCGIEDFDPKDAYNDFRNK